MAKIAHELNDDEEWDREIGAFPHELAVELLMAIAKEKEPSNVPWMVAMDDYFEEAEV